MKKTLAHICCAPCALYSLEKLVADGHEITGYFYNPNIHPESEYIRRRSELVKLVHPVIIEEDLPEIWHEAVTGLEKEKEGGQRCVKCFELRLEKTAARAVQDNYDAFTTVLTISPHKNTALINKIGRETAQKYGIVFIEEDFKKDDGFKKAVKLSQKYGFYRQKYCGCLYGFLNKTKMA